MTYKTDSFGPSMHMATVAPANPVTWFGEVSRQTRIEIADVREVILQFLKTMKLFVFYMLYEGRTKIETIGCGIL